MSQSQGKRPLAIVTGAAGQDGFYLIERLVQDGFVVHGTIRPGGSTFTSERRTSDQAIVIHELDLEEPAGYTELIAALKPDELYNLAGMSSVAASFVDPAAAWRTNADAVEAMLEAVRKHSPATRFYQSSSSEMFGAAPGQESTRTEDSPLRPQSPYAAAKAAAHVLCAAYRRAYDMRIACGILFNHESSRRPATFLTRKVVDHVRTLRRASPAVFGQRPPLAMGNLAARRDWGFAPDYVDGIRRIIGQIEVRARVLGEAPEEDRGSNYRDYVLGTGKLHTVWELVDRAFYLGGLPLDWDLAGDPSRWLARFRATSHLAVVVDPTFIRPADPPAIRADSSRARTELGWTPRTGLDPFLHEMLESGSSFSRTA
ncbi:MAG TPA: GDP-mannose 4,6-dehydratase, partial [Candidatus Limnocylindrales bacterium]